MKFFKTGVKPLFVVLLITFTNLLIISSVFAQTPAKMSYQAIIRDAANKLVVNQSVGMRISILKGSANGTVVYTETQRPSTNANGLVAIEIGGGDVVSGNFSTIDWAVSSYFIKTETDPTGGTVYSITGTNQLLGVPFAFHATQAESLTKPIVETDPEFSAWDKSTGINIKENQISDLDHFTNADETDPKFSAWDKSTGIKISENQITDLDHFTNADEIDPRYASDSSFIKTGVRSWNSSLSKTIDAADTTHWGKAETDPGYAADSSFIKRGTRSWNSSLAKTIDAVDTTHWGKAENDPVFSAWNKRTGITISESQITDLDHFTNADEIDPKYAADSSFIKRGTRSWNSSLAKTIDIADTTHWGKAENDPVFSGWNKRTGITISESQITDLDHFTNADEIDPRYAADSSFIKTGVRNWNSSLAKTIDAADTTHWGKAETDPVFSGWNKRTGITISESQITDLDHFTNADEIDPRYAADSSFIKTGVRNWNSSLAKTIDAADTTHWGKAETDPVFSVWDKHSGIAITESQITDLDHFTTADEIDPRYSADSSFIKSGVRDWNSSLAKTIDATDTTHWGKAETDPVFTAWDKHTGIAITENQITDLDHFTTADEIDPRYSVDSSFIKNGVRNWNSSLAKTIDAADTARWGQINSFDGNYSSLTNAPNIANSTAAKTISLSSATSSSSLTINSVSATPLLKVQGDGLVGINNVSSPRASLEVGGYDGLLVTGTRNVGAVRALGAGVRMHWYPRKGAFRAGEAETTWWDDDGSAYPRLALFSVGLGYHVRASATASYAMGAYCQATGDYSLAMGAYSEASGSHSFAIGTGGSVPCRASGIYSIALGQGADTNGRDGSMVVGDDMYYQTAYSSADNQLTMRFSGGYRLWTSYPDSTAGVYMRHGANGWSNYCDRNKKTNFKKLDFEEVLKKVDKIPVTEWNYKGNDTMKYIGPMAQDFWQAFQLGGTDSLGINSICIDGVNMAAIKGLIQRTDALNDSIRMLNMELETERQNTEALQKELLRLSSIEQKNQLQDEQIEQLIKKINELTK